MEIKHTLEILTKDIQDIEKLVGNLQNSADGSSIDLDLALSKLRNVYEILSMIKADRWNEMVSRAAAESRSQGHTSPASRPEPQAQPLTVPEEEILTPSKQEAQQQVTQPQPDPIPEPHPEAKVSPVPKEPGILAEKFHAQSSINENLASKREKDVDTRLSGQPIENIGRHIGLNDRFLIIRELFNGDSDRFSSMVSNLDSAGNYDDALGILESQFTGSMDHEGVGILSALIKRRYIKG